MKLARNARLLLLIGVVIAGLLGTMQSQATLWTILSLDPDIVGQTRDVVVGKVSEVTSGLDSERNRVYTYTTVQVDRTIASRDGNPASAEVVFKTPGGDWDGMRTVAAGMPYYATGEEVLLFLQDFPQDSKHSRVVGYGQGTYRIYPDQQDKKYVLRDIPENFAAGTVVHNNQIRAAQESRAQTLESGELPATEDEELLLLEEFEQKIREIARRKGWPEIN